MNTAASVSTYILRKLWNFVAIVLVLFALTISLLRYSLPYLNDEKARVENYISKQYAVALSIEELSASWNTSGPALVLKGVKIEKDERSPIGLEIGELFLEIDFWPSLYSVSLQSRQVVLRSLHADIELSKIEAGETEFPIVQALERVFLEHLSDFSLVNSRITLNTEKNSKSFDIESLSWLNRENRHQGAGVFAVEGFANNNARFVLDLYGDMSSYSGILYAEAIDLDLSAWLNEFANLEGKLKESKGNIEVWASIDNGSIQRVDGEIKPTSFNWENGDFALANDLSGKFAAVSNGDKWQFSVNDLLIKNGEREILTGLDGEFDSISGFVLKTQSDIAITSLLPITGIFSAQLAEKLTPYSLNVPTVSMQMAINNEGVWAKVDAHNISWNAHGAMVGASGISANMYYHNDDMKVMLSGDEVALSSTQLFDRHLKVNTIDVPIFIALDTGLVSIQNALFSAHELALSADLEFATKNQFMSLHVDISPTTLSDVALWLPNQFMDKGVKTFLTNAFVGGGNVTQASVLWHGTLSDFPFENKQGVFQSFMAVEQADFLFSEGWPALTQFDINLLFENSGLLMTSPASRLDQVALSDLRANIPNLTKNALLTIAAQGRAASSDLTSLMLKSSLSDSLGALLSKNVQIEGDLTTNLQIVVPLTDGSKTKAVGQVFMNNNSVRLPDLLLDLEHVDGIINFDNENITINGLQAKLLDQAVSVDLMGMKTETSYDLNISAQGDWDVNQLATHVSADFAQYLQGNTSWDLNLNVALLKGDFSYNALLSSNLLGTRSALPAPFNKTHSDERIVSITAKGTNLASSITANIDNVAKFDGALAHKEQQFNRAHLSIGPTEFESRGVGFSISGDFDNLEAEKWFSLIASLSPDNKNNRSSIIGLPQRIFIKANKVTLFGETLSDVDVTTKRLSDQWSLDIDSDQVRANVLIYDEWFSKGIKVDAQYVRLTRAESPFKKDDIADESNKVAISARRPRLTIDPKDLPSLDITCKSCSFYGFDFGRLEMEAEPNNDGLKINQLLVNNKFGNINASGQWYKRNQDHFTFIAGDMFSNDIGEFIKLMGFDSGVQDSEANISFALTWKDSPLDIQFENLDGEVNWRLSDGYLTEVSDKGSRIFSLLSLSSLVRKLSLDFRDVFAKGFFYDSMQGSVQITEGKADTRDTLIDGAAGEIEIYGYTDLANQGLNYNVSFAPNVTGNLPVLVYFFTVSPPSALAALALDQVLTSAKVISNVNYSVTGTIKAPILIETGRESTEVELPARRDIQAPDNKPDFIPPTPDDLLQIEVTNGQSD